VWRDVSALFSFDQECAALRSTYPLVVNIQTPSVPATKVRWRVVGLLALVAGATYIDRLNLGIVAKYIQEDFRFDTQTMGWILGAFSLGYALFHIPGGWLADRFGPRPVLAAAVLWFSVFTAATPIAPHLPGIGWLGAAWAFVITRFLMGTGEAAAIPVGNKMMAYWLGPNERAFGTSVFLTGVGVGGVVAPVLIGGITKSWGWESSFFLLGTVGVFLALGCYFYVTNRPEENPHVNSTELALIRGNANHENVPSADTPPTGIPWRKIFSSRSMWGLMVSHLCLVYPLYIFFTWFFIYLVRVRGITISKASLWGSAPFLANIFMVPLWGWFADRMARWLGKARGRRAAAWLGIVSSALFLLSGSHTSNNTLAILQLALAAGFNFAASAVLWTACTDISSTCSGSVSAVMTTFGSLGGSASPILTAFIATRFGWSSALDFAAIVTIASGLAWFFINTGESIEQAG
jgi:ACS family glucarate transporter-like MFS transporter